ncbi:MAG TPA: GNAT family N-acetyltransferase, partial [Alphaproteobacteria bacterium]|nr:GNAT family N-acetyltransferase [Alphaproteobacteria bacterium]
MTRVEAKLCKRIRDLPERDWDRLAAFPDGTVQPFVRHAFLKALEDSGCVGGRTGWNPVHVSIEVEGELAAVAPLY